MYLSIKRALDIAGSLLGIVILTPVMVAVAAIVRLTIGKPILFRQRRPGLREVPFTCLKFRTMSDSRDRTGALLSDELRLTRCGRFLRRTSLDELPQLFNVLRGDLSFVGPRPLLQSYTEFYTFEERRRHTVRPGITGWAQIHGRRALTFEQRFAYDLFYVDHISFRLDLRILARTIGMLLNQGSSTVIADAPEISLDVLRSQGNAHPHNKGHQLPNARFEQSLEEPRTTDSPGQLGSRTTPQTGCALGAKSGEAPPPGVFGSRKGAASSVSGAAPGGLCASKDTIAQ